MQLLHGLATGQVLQRVSSKNNTASALLSGTAATEGPVTATLRGPGKKPLRGWNGKAVGQARRGTFKALLQGVPSGGPYRLELRSGKQTAVVPSFFVGDVWLLAGQSNMEGCGHRSGAAKPHPLIRAFSLRREWRAASEPLHILAESPDSCHTARTCSPEESEALRRTAVKGTGPGLHFAREMLRRTGVPQGLICTAHGGTSMTQWDPAKKTEGGASLYGSMLLSVRATGQPVAGVLWYQGESDTGIADAPLYRDRMRRLVSASRKDLKQAGLPWIVVQIGRVFGSRSAAESAAWNQVQEEQRLLPGHIARLETVAIIDLPLDDHIHIGAAGHPRLGVRLARAADRLVHGSRGEARPPRPKSIGEPYFDKSSAGIVLDVTFDDVVGGLRSHGEPQGFALVHPEGQKIDDLFKVTLHGATARLHLRTTPLSGTALSYGHGVTPVCNITDGRDLSLPVFGPLPIGKPCADLPFVVRWKKSPVLPASVPLDKVTPPDLDAPGSEAVIQEYADSLLEGFIDEHLVWQGKSGQAHFAAKIDLPEPMRLAALMGYDGPFRLWIDGKPFFTDLQGTNPCIPDESRKAVRLDRGPHTLHVALDLNNGRAWGFFLRFRRLDVTPAQIRSKDYPKPLYSV